MRIRLLMSVMLSSAVFIAASAACSGKSDSDNVVWDEEERSCVIPSVGLLVRLPADGEWIVANSDSLPDEMVFCALNAERQVLVGAIVPSVAIVIDHVEQIDQADYHRQIVDLTRQQVAAIYGNIELRPVAARYGNLLRFRQIVNLSDSNADSTVSMVYDGVFGVGNRRPFMIFDTHVGSSSGLMDEIIEKMRAVR